MVIQNTAFTRPLPQQDILAPRIRNVDLPCYKLRIQKRLG